MSHYLSKCYFTYYQCFFFPPDVNIYGLSHTEIESTNFRDVDDLFWNLVKKKKEQKKSTKR